MSKKDNAQQVAAPTPEEQILEVKQEAAPSATFDSSEVKASGEKKKDTKKPSAETIEAKSKRLFAIYPTAKELHFTSDREAFFKMNDAKNHAAGLKDQKVETVKRK